MIAKKKIEGAYKNGKWEYIERKDSSYLPINNDYQCLQNVLDRAYQQAAHGKGKDRHACENPFEKQPIIGIQELVGNGFALGQAIKKMQESQRLTHEAAIKELLGAINYICGAIIYLEQENKK